MFAACGLIPGRVSPLRAQVPGPRVAVPAPLLVVARNNLSFGTVLPGVPAIVTVGNLERAGVFEIVGPADATVRVEFVLPAALANDKGAVIPLSFGHGDGLSSYDRGSPGGFSFNPHLPVVRQLSPEGRLWVRLGGTALPARPQAKGNYFATIAVTVYDLGS